MQYVNARIINFSLKDHSLVQTRICFRANRSPFLLHPDKLISCSTNLGSEWTNDESYGSANQRVVRRLGSHNPTRSTEDCICMAIHPLGPHTKYFRQSVRRLSRLLLDRPAGRNIGPPDDPPRGFWQPIDFIVRPDFSQSQSPKIVCRTWPEQFSNLSRRPAIPLSIKMALILRRKDTLTTLL